MKQILTIGLLMIMSKSIAQTTIFPGLLLDQNSLNTIWSGDILNYGEVKTSGLLNYNNSGNLKTTISSESIHLTPGTNISTHNGSSSYFKIDKGNFDLAWFAPQTATPAQVLKNDKLEVGLTLDNATEQKITNFVEDLPGTKVNPYNPDEVDIMATFYKKDGSGNWQLDGKTYGFYYENFQRQATDWDKLPTDHRMRIRYTPQNVGEYKCIIGVKLNGGPEQFATHFHFECIPSSLPGFMKVGANNQYFEVDGQTFFPIGNNLPSPQAQDNSYGQISKPDDYRSYLSDITELKNSGGNYFRMLMGPQAFGLEFEKMNNYTSRLNQAWELDQVIDTVKKLDVRIHLNMMFHYAFGYLHGYGARKWDWTRYDDPVYDIVPYCKDPYNDTSGYCYRTDQNKNNTRDFLTNPVLKNNYKKRIRYLYSRWGYSPNIATVQLISEFNELWTPASDITSHQPPLPPNKTACIPDKITSYEYYVDDLDDIPEKVGAWNLEMAGYIKNDLGHTQHLLSASYAGHPRPENGDLTIASDLIDFTDYNDYKTFYDTWYNLSGADQYIKFTKTFPNDYNYSKKPVFNSEVSSTSCDNWTTWQKDVLLRPFTGYAGALPWLMSSTTPNMTDPQNLQTRNELWDLFGNVGNFIQNYDLANENWSPIRFVSQDGSYDMVCLRKGDGSKYIGAIHNRTWNFYTQRNTADTGSVCDLNDAQIQGFPDIYEDQDIIESSVKGSAVIAAACDAPYIVEFYNPFNGTYIGNTQEISSPLVAGDFFFQQFHFPDVSLGRPIIYFEATASCPSSMNVNSNVHYSSVNQLLEEDTLIKQAYLENMQKDISNQPLVLNDSLSRKAVSQLNLYPNPTSKKIVVDINSSEKIRWSLHSSSGQNLDYGNFSGQQLVIDMSFYCTGVYYLKLRGSSINEQFKIVKQ